jgi:hypothetical protein
MLVYYLCYFWQYRDRRGRDSMVVGFITTYAISDYHHLCSEFESRSGEVYSIQHLVIKFVNDGELRFSPPKTLTTTT